MLKKIKFSISPPGGDRVHHISEADIRVVLSRLPEETYSRLKGVHFNDRAWGNRRLGYTNRGRREIALCALPPRMSFTPFMAKGHKSEHFGAIRGTQWPNLAIRRFLLYDVFLHELGHLQIIDPNAKGSQRKFAREGKAQEFAMSWYKQLWSEPFSHPDPAHNPPTKSELKLLKLEKSGFQSA